MVQQKQIQLGTMRLWVRSLASLSGLRNWHCCALWCRLGTRFGSGIAVSCGAGCRHGLDLVLLWLWSRPAATAPIKLLAWEPPYATGAALEKTKKRKKGGNGIHYIE